MDSSDRTGTGRDRTGPCAFSCAPQRYKCSLNLFQWQPGPGHQPRCTTCTKHMFLARSGPTPSATAALCTLNMFLSQHTATSSSPDHLDVTLTHMPGSHQLLRNKFVVNSSTTIPGNALHEAASSQQFALASLTQVAFESKTEVSTDAIERLYQESKFPNPVAATFAFFAAGAGMSSALPTAASEAGAGAGSTTELMYLPTPVRTVVAVAASAEGLLNHLPNCIAQCGKLELWVLRCGYVNCYAMTT